jgi:hypothetical protein
VVGRSLLACGLWGQGSGLPSTGFLKFYFTFLDFSFFLTKIRCLSSLFHGEFGILNSENWLVYMKYRKQTTSYLRIWLPIPARHRIGCIWLWRSHSGQMVLKVKWSLEDLGGLYNSVLWMKETWNELMIVILAKPLYCESDGKFQIHLLIAHPPQLFWNRVHLALPCYLSSILEIFLCDDHIFICSISTLGPSFVANRSVIYVRIWKGEIYFLSLHKAMIPPIPFQHIN